VIVVVVISIGKHKNIVSSFLLIVRLDITSKNKMQNSCVALSQQLKYT